MLNKLLPKQIEITVGGQELRFSSIEDFEFCMNGRTSVPSKKITQMVKFSADQLKKEARTIKDIEKMFVSILSRSIEDPGSINRALRELDSTMFSQDHSWRAIIAALNEGGDGLNPLRRVALVKYMQYLSSRQEIIKYLYSEKQSPAGTSDSADLSDEIENLKDTLILENTLFEPLSGDSKVKGGLERMPKGEVINLVLKPGKDIVIMLSKHKCRFLLKDGIYFIDQNGKSHAVNKGRNVVGRDAVSDIRMDSNLRDISRLHLVVENIGDNCLLLTDMSSHGTFLPEKFLESNTAV